MKDKERQGQGSQNPFGLSDEDIDEVLAKAEEAGRRVRRIREEAEKSFRETILYCPYDSLPSKFVGYKGAYTIVRAFYKCEQGHEFAYSQGKTSPSDKKP